MKQISQFSIVIAATLERLLVFAPFRSDAAGKISITKIRSRDSRDMLVSCHSERSEESESIRSTFAARRTTTAQDHVPDSGKVM